MFLTCQTICFMNGLLQLEHADTQNIIGMRTCKSNPRSFTLKTCALNLAVVQFTFKLLRVGYFPNSLHKIFFKNIISFSSNCK